MKAHVFSAASVVLAAVRLNALGQAPMTANELTSRFRDGTAQERRTLVIAAIDEGLIRVGMKLSECSQLFGESFAIKSEAEGMTEGFAIVPFKLQGKGSRLHQSPSVGWRLVIYFDSERLVSKYYITNYAFK